MAKSFIMLRSSRLLNFATSILHLLQYQTSLHSQCLVSCLLSCHYFPAKPSVSLYLSFYGSSVMLHYKAAFM